MIKETTTGSFSTDGSIGQFMTPWINIRRYSAEHGCHLMVHECAGMLLYELGRPTLASEVADLLAQEILPQPVLAGYSTSTWYEAARLLEGIGREYDGTYDVTVGSWQEGLSGEGDVESWIMKLSGLLTLEGATRLAWLLSEKPYALDTGVPISTTWGPVRDHLTARLSAEQPDDASTLGEYLGEGLVADRLDHVVTARGAICSFVAGFRTLNELSAQHKLLGPLEWSELISESVPLYYGGSAEFWINVAIWRQDHRM